MSVSFCLSMHATTAPLHQVGDVREACQIFYAAQADPSLAPQERLRRRARTAPAPSSLSASAVEGGMDGAFLEEQDDRGLFPLAAAAAGGGQGAPHYLYTTLIAAFTQHGAWPAALYLYEDFMLAHGPGAMERPLATVVARCLNQECVLDLDDDDGFVGGWVEGRWIV